MNMITHWRPGVAAAALKNKTPTGKAALLRWASEKLAEAACIVPSPRADTMPLYGASTVPFSAMQKHDCRGNVPIAVHAL